MRVSTFSTFGRILLGLRANQATSLRAQEQLSSGRRILRASDDPAGTARALALRRGLAHSERIQSGVTAGRGQLDLAASTLQHASELLSRARELVVQSMNGTLNADDRETIASELVEIRKQLLDHANLERDGSHVFGGTAVGRPPWVEITSAGRPYVTYRGTGEEQRIQAGTDALVAITAIGAEIFGGATRGPARFDGLTGVSSGTTADEGAGYAYLLLRHDATDLGTLAGTGVALVDGGDRDTLLGTNALTIDAAAGTVQLGSGPPVTIPDPSERGDLVVRNEQGGELHLDLSAWDGLDHAGSVAGEGSISLDGDTFRALTFTETDLELADGSRGHVLHLDTRGVLRAGQELVTFGDTVNAFDLLQGVAEDLRNAQGLDSGELAGRLGARLDSLDGVHDDLLVGLGVLGARSARLASADARQGELELQLRGRLSEVEDADLSETAIDLARSQLILEVAQAAGVRVLQTSLLDYLR
jgi:flagellin-like hook-associated protein FlgL